MNFPDTLVVDASVGVKLFLEEEGSREAEAIFALLAGVSPRTLAVPDLFFVECANVFRSRVHRRLMKLAAARDAFGILRALPLKPVASGDLAAAALDLALDQGISVYDAVYAVLARTLAAPLVTADARLLAALRKAGIAALPLS